jgi:hypothetical protein
MRKSRRLVLPLAASSLVAASGITLGLALVANANTQGFCDSTTTAPITCTLPNSSDTDTTINTPSAIQVSVTLNTGSPAQFVGVTYTLFCSQGGAEATTTQATAPALPVDQAISVGAPVTDTLVLGEATPDSCTVETVTATLYTDNAAKTQSTSGSFRMQLTWTPGSTPSATTTASSTASTPPPPVTVSLIKGYGGKCVDDKGNSSSNGAAVIIWSCNSGDSAQGWTFSGGELKHNGKCANDQGNGGSGSKVILWSCNGASNEKWFHSGSDGEFILSSTNHGLLCLNDPGYSKSNGTRLIVYKCQNTSNEHWT